MNIDNLTLAVRDSHAALRDVVLTQWYDDQSDQLMFDVIDDLTREVAQEVYAAIHLKLQTGEWLDSTELQNFILQHDPTKDLSEFTVH